MNALTKKLGRPPHISDRQIAVLRNLLATGALASTRAVQRHLSKKVLRYTKPDAVSLQTTRKCMRKAGYSPKINKTALSMPEHRISELVHCLPEMNQYVAPILQVAAGVPVREAARNARINQRTLRDRFCRARDKGLKGLSLPHGKFLNAFFAWCDKVKKPTLKKAATYFAKRTPRSPRTLHRYIMEWKDLRGIPRRHWNCGGSKWA